MSKGVLYVVATPIGNLDDLTPRAVETLKQVDFIAAEDTRHTRPLLRYYAIDTPMQSLHQFNEQSKLAPLLDALSNGESIALVSDAGTPLISDPGFPLVRAFAAEGGKHCAYTGCECHGVRTIRCGSANRPFSIRRFSTSDGIPSKKLVT